MLYMIHVTISFKSSYGGNKDKDKEAPMKPYLPLPFHISSYVHIPVHAVILTCFLKCVFAGGGAENAKIFPYTCKCDVIMSIIQ